MVKNLPASSGDISNMGSIPGSARLKRKWQPSPGTVAWRIPWTKELGGL